MITFEDIKNDEEIKILIEDTERQLMELGYTEHGYRHYRMLMCKGAANFLGVWFHLEINGSLLL